MARLVYSIGHSIRSGEELVALLLEFAITLLVDVRRFPASRRYPQFGKERLARRLDQAGIGYFHEPDLGGHRRPRAGSPNTAWKEEAFRGYADHMDSGEFQEALLRVQRRADETVVVVMCAEADPRRCHRRLLADALLAHGAEVRHILSPGRFELDRLHSHARLLPHGRIVYDAGRQLSLTTEGVPE